MASVRSIGYLVIDATDLDAWEKFGADLCGMQVAVKTADRLEFRIDEKEYRFVINKADTDGVRVLGWEVDGPQDLEEISARLAAAGYAVTSGTDEQVRERRVTALASFADPDGEITLELFTGLREANDRFVSPTGAGFTNRARDGQSMGFGHVFQAVRDAEEYKKLYLDILGFKLSDHIEVGAAGAKRDATFTHCNPRQHSFAFSEAG